VEPFADLGLQSGFPLIFRHEVDAKGDFGWEGGGGGGEKDKAAILPCMGADACDSDRREGAITFPEEKRPMQGPLPPEIGAERLLAIIEID